MSNKTKTKNADYTHIAFVLDRSYSMNATVKDTISGFNDYLIDQKTVPGKATVTLAQFDHEYDLLNDFDPIGEVQLLTDSTYVPRGGTALLDAVGVTINVVSEKISFLDEKDRPDKVIICILTDGEENRSNEFKPNELKSLISDKEDMGWEFVFIGANQDAMLAAEAYGVKRSSAMTYAQNSVGTQSAFSSLSKNTRSYRTGNGQSMSFNAVDYSAQCSAGVDPNLNVVEK